MSRTEAPVVRKQVVVNAPVEQAFAAFTERFGDFKPLYLARYTALIDGR